MRIYRCVSNGGSHGYGARRPKDIELYNALQQYQDEEVPDFAAFGIEGAAPAKPVASVVSCTVKV
jgi:hypothetical protein